MEKEDKSDNIMLVVCLLSFGLCIGLCMAPLTAKYHALEEQRNKLSDVVRMSLDNDSTNISQYLETVELTQEQLTEWSYCY